MSGDGRATILMVEDDLGLARLQRLRLERAGYTVFGSTTAAEALDCVRQGGIDLIVLDQRLPGAVSGLELYRQVKDAGFDIPAILVTAFNDERLILEAFRSGVYDFVPKTADYLDHLLPAVARVLETANARRRLHESEAKLAAVFKSVLDPVLTTDDAGLIGLLNPAAEELFGCPADIAVGRPIWDFLPSWPRSAATDRVAALANVSGEPWRWEAEGVRHDGGRVPLEISVARTAASGRPFWVFVARDIRDRLRAMEEQERLIREQAARAEAESATRAKDEFLAMLAHELRNPLAPIRNALEIVRLHDPEGRAPSHHAWNIVARQVEHLVRLVDDLLDMSRITRGKINLQLETVGLADVVARAVEASQPLIQARRHELQVDLAAEPLFVRADPVRLSQVLLNLLNNAAKYTPEGGRVSITARSEDGQAVIRVRDTGMGIPAETLPKVFDLFSQAERTLDRAEGGLGIGLTLVQRLVEMHGGSVGAHSDGPGHGSEFTVRIPVLPAGTRSQETPAPSAALPHTQRRVLVVDDNVDSAESLGILLRLNGHEVRTAYEGRAALDAAREFQPQVVLLDIGLPGLDGFEVARRLRSDPATQRSCLVAVTGYGQEEDQRRTREAGFNHHLTKPVDPEVLHGLLAAAEPA
ncbi:MAG: response regulator [Planctomycetia bacterium]|nr:response regulator [Planctomycetia bacterium]